MPLSFRAALSSWYKFHRHQILWQANEPHLIITMIIIFFCSVQGLALLTVQAHYPGLRPPKCNIFDSTSHCEKVGGGNAALFFIALYLLAAGSAGIKAALPAHGADQFDEKDPREARDMSSFFNFLLLIVCLGSAASLTLIVWIQDNKGWDWGFGLSTIAMFLGVVLFTLGLPMHRIQPIQGTSTIVEIVQVYESSLISFVLTYDLHHAKTEKYLGLKLWLISPMSQVFVAAIHNRKLQLPEDPTELYEFDRDAEAAGDKEFLPYRDTFRSLRITFPTRKRTFIQIYDLLINCINGSSGSSTRQP